MPLFPIGEQYGEIRLYLIFLCQLSYGRTIPLTDDRRNLLWKKVKRKDTEVCVQQGY